jgi:hypothetical protein
MPKGVYERKPKEIPDMASETIQAEPEKKTKLFPIRLTKNYVPKDEYEIVGYLKEAVKVKDAAGRWTVLEPETFVEGEMKPHQTPGVGFGEMIMKDGTKVNAKIWAGTHIKVPLEEAKRAVSKKIAERADELA